MSLAAEIILGFSISISESDTVTQHAVTKKVGLFKQDFKIGGKIQQRLFFIRSKNPLISKYLLLVTVATSVFYQSNG